MSPVKRHTRAAELRRPGSQAALLTISDGMGGPVPETAARVAATCALLIWFSTVADATGQIAALQALGAQGLSARWHRADASPAALDVAAYAGKAVLFAGAHPDDIESCAAGTAALMVRAGASVCV